MQIRQYLSIPPALTSTLLGGDGYNPVTPVPNMPTLTTTSVLTSAVTLTSFVTVTTGQLSSSTGMASSVPASISSVVPSSVSTPTPSPSVNPYPNLPPKLVSAIEGLDDCTQTILFTNLANSPCNPADSSCICIQLRNAGLTNTIAATCTTDATTQYTGFQDNVCGPILASSSVPVSSTPAASSSSAPVSSSSMMQSSRSSVVVVVVVTSTTPAPVVSTPALVGNATTTTMYTNTALVPSVPSDTSAPGPSTVLPEPPVYTGGAAVVKRGVFGVVFAGL
ncbi:predicted protein [Pyrenophora tritici-repentis Pt-1C-BFP]|uniref:CFEM domain-containing protein n=1 Tax=Pyrenophora tritici-repentis (strain Pt-1C-BFP) TaxID=426418 RepID=B2WF47_PYRTR|nr:uncharacterized protein PTRG_08208 [Pyrenophora tritici-repentis Pt-1C-BFP]EDU51127.1 predicted protein [Pyrenophora tritici-repentis Pt-1C-BFP]